MTLPSASGNGSDYVHVADLVRSAPITGTRQSQHGRQFQKLHFRADGSIEDFNCAADAVHEVSYVKGKVSNTTALTTNFYSKDSSGVESAYKIVCDIPKYSLYQTWTASKSGTLKEVGINLGAGVISKTMEMPATYAVFRFSNTSALVSPHYTWETLATSMIMQSSLTSALPVYKLTVGKEIKEGDNLGIAITTMSGTTQLCTGRTNTTSPDRKLFANGPGQVSPRGPGGKNSPVIELVGEEMKWYAIVE